MPDVIAEPQRRSNHHLINRIRLIDGDLTAQHDVDAIIGSIPVTLDMSGSLNQAILRAAGEAIDSFILEHVYKPRPGDVFAVPPFNLPVPHILYAVSPVWTDSLGREDRDLTRCYRGAMELAKRMGLSRIAFSAIGSGRRKFPVARAARLGVQAILDRLDDSFAEVRIVTNNSEIFTAWDHWLRHHGWTGYVASV